MESVLARWTEGILFANATFRGFVLTDRNPLGGSTKRRYIEAPSPAMRTLHRRVIHTIRLHTLGKMQYATGAKPGCSPVRNAQKHRMNQYLFLVDLRSAYRHVKAEQLAGILCVIEPRLENQEEVVSAFLKTYFFSKHGGLAIGGPASPDLFNLYAWWLIDRALEPLLGQYGLTYTRYLDDLCFSSKQPIGRRKRRALLKIIREYFEISARKVIVADVEKVAVKITGVMLNRGGRISVPGKYKRRLSGHIHLAMQKKSSLAKVAGAFGAFQNIARTAKPTRTNRRLQEGFYAIRRLAR